MGEIRHYPDPILAEPAIPCSGLGPEALRLIDDKLRKAWSPKTAGLAGPQIGIPYRVVAVRLQEKIVTLVDPVLTLSGPTAIDTERCLSVISSTGHMVPIPVERYLRAEVSCRLVVELDRDRHDKIHPREFVVEHFEARLFQHEVDHLNGITIVEAAQHLPRQQRRQVYRQLGLS